MLTLDTLRPRLRQLKLSGMSDAIGPRAEEARQRGWTRWTSCCCCWMTNSPGAMRTTSRAASGRPASRTAATCATSTSATTRRSPRPSCGSWPAAASSTSTRRCCCAGRRAWGKVSSRRPSASQACRQRRTVLFTKTSAFLTDLAGGRADGSHAQRLRRYLSPSLLILDDFAMREYTVPQAEDLYELISRRYRRGALILTTNRAPERPLPALPQPGPGRGAARPAAQQRLRRDHARAAAIARANAPATGERRARPRHPTSVRWQGGQ